MNQLLDEVLSLAAEERSAVAAALIDSLEGAPDTTVAEAWRRELLARREALRSGMSRAAPWAETRARFGAL